MEQTDSLKRFNVTAWLLNLLGFSIIPCFLYYLFNKSKQKRNKSILRNKIVLITGASSGLGEALAHTFYQCGCKLILTSRRKEELERVKANLLQINNAKTTDVPLIVALDLTDIKSVQSTVPKIIENVGKIDILINNAGVGYRGEAIHTNIEVDMKVMLINYFAQINLSKLILPLMIKQESGHIVCISSVQGKFAIPHRSAYAASKHALQAWFDSCRSELNDQNIKITVINPGYIQTSLSLNALRRDGQTYGVMDKTTQEGYSPKYVSDRILKAVLAEEKEVTIATFSPKVAIVLRNLFPSLYFWIMQKRAKKNLQTD